MQYLDKPYTSLLRAAIGLMNSGRAVCVFSLFLVAGLMVGPGMMLMAGEVAYGQTPAQTETPASPAAAPASPAAAQTSPAAAQAPEPAAAPAEAPPLNEGAIGKFSGSEVTEDELRRQLVGKQLFLRGAYLGDSLSFSEHGNPTRNPAMGPFTLSGVEIEKVRLTKHKLELEGARYGLHYLVGLPDMDPNKEVDWVKITPKKKVLKLTIDREQVSKARAAKEKKVKGKQGARPVAGVQAKEAEQPAVGEPGATTVAPVGSACTAPASDKAPDNPAEQAADQGAVAVKETDEAADPKTVTTTTKPEHAAAMLRAAIDKVLAAEVDPRMVAQMPEFWQLYFQAKAAGVEYRPHDANVLRSNAVDQQAKVVSAIAPESNEFAQGKGISGRALYRAVVGADGAAAEIAVVRPIGFGLDEKAVEAIRKAKFQAAVKGGQPVAETLDLAVVFRIYSKQTGARTSETQTAEPAAPIKPGPYSVKPPQPNN